jgi:hypothetical protein
MAVPPVDSTPGLDVARSTTDGVTWVQATSDVRGAFLGGHHPLGFFWESTWPWGPPDDAQGSTAVMVSEDGETWTETPSHRYRLTHKRPPRSSQSRRDHPDCFAILQQAVGLMGPA